MGSNEIYTIGREFGSLGKQVGRDLAERLGIKFYDKELLQQAAKESGLCEEIFESHDEKPTNSFLYSLVMDTYTGGSYSTAPFLDMPLNHKVFLAQFDAIKKIAANESCVIVGRCADYVLRDADVRLLRVFVSAPEEQRIARKMEQEHLTQPQAARLLRKMDKQRRKYYETYTHHVWGDSTNYDLCIDTSACTLDEAAARIADRFRAMA